MEMVALPIAQFNVNGEAVPNFMMGNYEEGDKEIELVINMVRQAAEAGIPAIKYYLCALENQRTESTPPGRGGSIYSTWDLAKADADTPRYDKPVTAEENWRRKSRTSWKESFRSPPSARFRMACHPCGPLAAARL